MDKAKFMDVLKEKYEEVTETGSAFIQGDIPEKAMEGALKKYAKGAKADDILLLVDDTVLTSGKKGVVMTSDTVYFSSMITDDVSVKYSDIDRVEVKKDGHYAKLEDDPNYSISQLHVVGKNGSDLVVYDTSAVRKLPLKEILDAALQYLV